QYAAGALGVATPMCPKCLRLHARPARAPLPVPAPAPASGQDEGHGHEDHEHRDGEEYAHDRGEGHEGHEGHRHGEGTAAGRNASLAGRWPYLRRELVAVVLSGVALGLGFIGVWRAWPEQVTTALFLVSILAGAVEIVPRGLRGVLRERSLDINFLITLAVLGAVLLGEYGEGATVVFLFALGEALEGITMARTRRAIEALMAIAPETAQVKAPPGAPDGAERTVRAEAVPVGSIVVVRPGDRIPLDGVVVEGRSVVDQAPITGESVPVDRAPGDAVFGGTINGAGYLEVRTTRPFAENTLSRIIHLVQSAQSEKAPSQRLVERFARVYTPLVVLAAVLVATVPALFFGQPIEPWFQRALVLLLIACPCALVLATPVAVVAAIGNASRHGVLIKGGVYLERAGELRAVAFDKTGTLTRGVPEVQRVVPFKGLSEADAVRLAAAVEARSEHPLAEAVVRAAARRGPVVLPAVREFLSFPGLGVRATVGDAGGQAAAPDEVFVGQPGWLEAQGLSLGAAREALTEAAAAGQTAVLVAGGRNGVPRELLALLALADEVRPAAAETVQSLRRIGVQRVVLLSGDNQATAGAVGARVGIAPQDVRGGLLPEDKVAAIKDLVGRYRQVAMVGDGVNDAPALASATVGIAMGAGGSATALETADVALVADDLSRVPWVLELSRRASRTIKANVAFALLSKAVVIALAVAGLANLWLAIATDVGATILVILNGMRLLGEVSTTGPADADAARRRYGLSQASAPGGAHAGHAH
ncbi:MAG TPA: heavy metal translocating P-type ATPase, partial [Chloroflexota bacterium]|nr:heavy metal translocating P-type ATPase [Chloroflexota bacterium]